MFVKSDEAKILENEYLEKLKSIIVDKHADVFGEFKGKASEDFVFDNLKNFVDEFSSAIYKKIEELGKMRLSDEEFLKREKMLLDENMMKLKKILIIES